jgi:uncharacterized protein
LPESTDCVTMKIMEANLVRHGIDLGSESIRQFCARWKVRQLDVFGSVTRQDFGPDSDVDFIVDFQEDAEWDLHDLFDMREELVGIVDRPVDLLTRYSIDSDSNVLFKQSVLKGAQTIYAS